MRSRSLLIPSILISLLVLNASSSSYSQQVPNGKPLNLVVPNSKGRIIIPASSGEVQWQGVNLYDQGTRPVVLTKNVSKNLVVSYALFPNKTGSSSPGICRGRCRLGGNSQSFSVARNGRHKAGQKSGSRANQRSTDRHRFVLCQFSRGRRSETAKPLRSCKLVQLSAQRYISQKRSFKPLTKPC